MSLHLTPISGIPLIHAGDNLAEIIWNALKQTGISLEDGDIVVIAQKVVSKAEGRIVTLSTVVPRPTALDLAASTRKSLWQLKEFGLKIHFPVASDPDTATFWDNLKADVETTDVTGRLRNKGFIILDDKSVEVTVGRPWLPRPQLRRCLHPTARPPRPTPPT